MCSFGPRITRPSRPSTGRSSKRLRESGATQIVATAPGVPWLLAMYLEVGYFPWHKWLSGVFYLKGKADTVPERLADPEAWYLSAADSDMHTFKMRDW